MRVALYKGRARLFNRLVAWWTRGPYSHCEAILNEEGGVALCASSSFLDGGVRVKWIKLDPAKWDVVDVPGWDVKRAAAWFAQHTGDRYDVFGIVGFVISRIRHARGKWFCSESILQSIGVPDAWRFNPNELAAIAHAAGGSSTKRR